MIRIILSALVLVAPSVTQADAATADCEVWHKGELMEDRSGECVFSQRQGYIGLSLSNGTRFDLLPVERYVYEDQEGREVHRTVTEKENIFKWEDRRIVVRWLGL